MPRGGRGGARRRAVGVRVGLRTHTHTGMRQTGVRIGLNNTNHTSTFGHRAAFGGTGALRRNRRVARSHTIIAGPMLAFAMKSGSNGSSINVGAFPPGRHGFACHPYKRGPFRPCTLWENCKFEYRPWGWPWAQFGFGRGLGTDLSFRPWAFFSFDGLDYPTMGVGQLPYYPQTAPPQISPQPLPTAITLSFDGLEKLEYDSNSWKKKHVKIEAGGLYFFDSESDTNASGWMPFLFDVVACPIEKDVEKKASNSTSKGRESKKNLDKVHCLKISACDPKRNYMARTYYLFCASDEQRDRIVDAVNFNTTLLCENSEAVSEYVNRLLPVLAPSGLPRDIHALIHEQIELIRSNRWRNVPDPPPGMLPPVALLNPNPNPNPNPSAGSSFPQSNSNGFQAPMSQGPHGQANLGPHLQQGPIQCPHFSIGPSSSLPGNSSFIPGSNPNSNLNQGTQSPYLSQPWNLQGGQSPQPQPGPQGTFDPSATFYAPQSLFSPGTDSQIDFHSAFANGSDGYGSSDDEDLVGWSDEEDEVDDSDGVPSDDPQPLPISSAPSSDSPTSYKSALLRNSRTNDASPAPTPTSSQPRLPPPPLNRISQFAPGSRPQLSSPSIQPSVLGSQGGVPAYPSPQVQDQPIRKPPPRPTTTPSAYSPNSNPPSSSASMAPSIAPSYSNASPVPAENPLSYKSVVLRNSRPNNAGPSQSNPFRQ